MSRNGVRVQILARAALFGTVVLWSVIHPPSRAPRCAVLASQAPAYADDVASARRRLGVAHVDGLLSDFPPGEIVRRQSNALGSRERSVRARRSYALVLDLVLPARSRAVVSESEQRERQARYALEETEGVRLCRVRGVRLRQKRLDALQDLHSSKRTEQSISCAVPATWRCKSGTHRLEVQTRLPALLLIENREADSAAREDVGVEERRRELACARVAGISRRDTQSRGRERRTHTSAASPGTPPGTSSSACTCLPPTASSQRRRGA